MPAPLRVPEPPAFPGRRPADTIKATQRTRLAAARWRQRAQPALAQPMALTQYDVKTHGLDLLVYWWAHAMALGEHVELLGSVAQTPMRFVQAYAACDLMVMHVHDAWP